MSRDHHKLEVLRLADDFVIRVYRSTVDFPIEERFGLQSQIRRVAVSMPTNIVEGCARHTTKDYLHFLTMSLASACETRYLIDLSNRLGFVSEETNKTLEPMASHIIRSLQKLTDRIRESNDQ